MGIGRTKQTPELQTLVCGVFGCEGVIVGQSIGGKYILSCAIRAAKSSSNFLLDSVPAPVPDLTYPEPVLRHFTDGQQLIVDLLIRVQK